MNSFDQWGVELGKVLAKNVRSVFADKAKGGAAVTEEDLKGRGFGHATAKLMKKYIDHM